MELRYERLTPTTKLYGAGLQKISAFYSKLVAAATDTEENRLEWIECPSSSLDYSEVIQKKAMLLNVAQLVEI